MAIRIAKPQRVVHTDEITRAQTTHYTLEIDVTSKAVSFDEAERVRKRKTRAFFRAWFVPIAIVQPSEPESLVSSIARDIEEAESALRYPLFTLRDVPMFRAT